MNIDRMPQGTRVGSLIGSAVGFVILATTLFGCGDDNNRVPTQTEVKAADTNRQSYIDKLNIPEDQKAQMKAHMGGPPAPSTMDAARKDPAPKGRQ